MTPKNIQVLILGTCECHLTWPRGFHRCDYIKGLGKKWLSDYHGLPEWALNEMTSILRESEGYLTTREEEENVTTDKKLLTS